MVLNLQQAIDQLKQLRNLIKTEWDTNQNPMDAGCYKALNAMIAVLEGGEDDEQYYVFTRLVEAISHLADHYDLSLPAALKIGGVR